MNICKLLWAVFGAAFFLAGAAHAQTPGAVTNHAFVIGRGAGNTGYTSLLCGSAQLAVGQSAADPICRTITGDVTLTAAGVTAIGATKVTSAMLNADVFSTAHSWAGQQTFVSPILGTPASGTLTNTTGFPLANLAGAGTGVLTFLATPSSANLRAALTDEVGTGAAYFVGGALGTPASGTATNLTGLPVAGIAAIGAYTFVGNNTGSSAVPTAVDIAALTTKASPAAGDYVMLSDQAASGAWKKATASSLAGVGAVGSINGQTGAVVSYFPPQGRLSLTSGTPVMTATTSGQTTVYYTPYAGNMVPIYDGTNMVPTAFAEVSQTTTDTTKSPAAVANNSVYDIFCWVDTGPTNRCTRGPAWTNDTTRSAGTALTRVNGIYLNNASITNGPAASRGTYVGTIRSNGSAQIDWILGGTAAGGTAGFLGVWNAYNRALVSVTVSDSADSYNYTVAAWRPSANNSSTFRISYVSGLQEEAFTAEYFAIGAAAAGNGWFGIGYDVTNAFSGTTGAVGGTALVSAPARFSTTSLGVHFMSGIEYANTGGGNFTVYGDLGVPAIVQTGLHFVGRM